MTQAGIALSTNTASAVHSRAVDSHSRNRADSRSRNRAVASRSSHDDSNRRFQRVCSSSLEVPDFHGVHFIGLVFTKLDVRPSAADEQVGIGQRRTGLPHGKGQSGILIALTDRDIALWGACCWLGQGATP